MQTPIYQAPPHHDITPHSYVIIKTASHCKCGALHEQSQVFAKTHLRSRSGHAYVPNLRPVRDPSEIAWNLPITVESRPIVQLPFCHDCYATVSLAHLPGPPVPTNEQIANKLKQMGIVQHEVKRTRYYDKHSRERYEDTDEPTPPAAKAAAKKFTIDDL